MSYLVDQLYRRTNILGRTDVAAPWSHHLQLHGEVEPGLHRLRPVLATRALGLRAVRNL